MDDQKPIYKICLQYGNILDGTAHLLQSEYSYYYKDLAKVLAENLRKSLSSCESDIKIYVRKYQNGHWSIEE